MKRKIIPIFGLMFIFMIALSSAQICEETATNQDMTIQYGCGNCTDVTVESIKYPNGTLLIVAEQMTNNGSIYYYSFSDISQNGVYTYILSTNGGDIINGCFTSTPNGLSLNLSQILIFTVFFGFIFLILLFLMDKVYHAEHPGMKIGFLLPAYLIWIFVVFILYRMIVDYLWMMDYLHEIFLYALIISMILTFPIFGISVVYLINEYMKSIKENEMKKRGHTDDSIRRRRFGSKE